MPLCGECDRYKQLPGISEGVGYCGANKENPYRRIRYHDDASKCPDFTELTGVVTDADQHSSMSPKLRKFRGYEEKKADVGVDPEKLKDEKHWG